MASKAAPTVDGGTLTEDIPCHRCGYDLRGLTPPGDCPECGWDLRDSIHAFRLRATLIVPPGPAWARQIREGAWLALAAAGVVVMVIIAPSEWFRMPFRDAPLSLTPGRILLLSLMCVGWALAWASTWKLTALERRQNERVFAARAARLFSTLYLLVPFAWAAATWTRQYPDGPAEQFLHALELCGLPAVALLMVRVAQLMNRRQAHWSAIAAFALAFGIPTSVIWLSLHGWYRQYEADPSSLGFMVHAYAFPAGIPELSWEVWHALLRGRGEHPLIWLLAMLPIWTVSVVLRLIWLYRPAVPAERNAASSAP